MLDLCEKYTEIRYRRQFSDANYQLK